MGDAIMGLCPSAARLIQTFDVSLVSMLLACSQADDGSTVTRQLLCEFCAHIRHFQNGGYDQVALFEQDFSGGPPKQRLYGDNED